MKTIYAICFLIACVFVGHFTGKEKIPEALISAYSGIIALIAFVHYDLKKHDP